MSIISTSYSFDAIADIQWDYNNYLYSLEIVSLDEPIYAGRTASIEVKIGANTDVVIHIELKGKFCWGSWIFVSTEIPLSSGESTISHELNIPFKTIVEPTSEFYIYVYVTLPRDNWNPSVWGLHRDVTICVPSDIKCQDLLNLLSHIKWLISRSELPDGIKTSLLSKFDNAGKLICSALNSGNLEKINGAMGSLKAILNELNSEKIESFFDSDLWEHQIDVLLHLIELYE